MGLLCRYPDYVLRKGGGDIPVTAANCNAYVSAVVDATLGGGVSRQARPVFQLSM